MNNLHSTPVVGKRCDKRELSTSSIEIDDENKRNKLSDSDMLQNSAAVTNVHLSEADLETITNRIHALFKIDLEAMVTSIVQAFVP